MMQSRFAAIVLCILAQAATAHSIAAPAAATPTPPATATHLQAVTATVVPAAANAAKPAAPARQGRELITSVAAGTHDGAPPAVSATARTRGQQDEPRRGGTAMLLAALALMSGIALRRYSAPRP